MNRLVLIDGNAILHRAFHALPPLTTSSGELVNAVYGFTSMLLKIFEQFHPEYVAVCFDRKAPTFRKEKYKDYQAKRPKMVDELIGQIDRVHEVVKTMNIPVFEIDGYEADDLIGTLATQATNFQKNQNTQKARKSERQKTRESDLSDISDFPTSPTFRHSEFSEKNGLETVIVTGDRDLLQLVNDYTKVYMPTKGLSQATLFDKEGVRGKMGVEPSQIPDLKALIGDQSDNYPGVAGIGPKTAIDLINNYDNIKNLYRHLHNLPKPIAEKLAKAREDADMSYYLATIIKDAPIKINLEKCKLTDYDWDEVAQLFDRLEFRSLIPRLPKDVHNIEKPTDEVSKQKEEEQMGLF